MSREDLHLDIDKIINNIIDYALILGSSLGAFAFLISLFGYAESGFKAAYIIFFIIVFIFGIAWLYRNKIEPKYKSIIIISGLFILIVTDAVKLGLFSDIKVLLVIIPFLSFMVFDFKKTIIIYSLSILGFLTIGYLFITGSITESTNYIQRASSINSWIINVVLITIVSFIIVFVVNQFYQTFLKLIRDLKQHNINIANSEQNYREIFNSSSDAIFIHDLNGKILDVNDAMLTVYGYDRTDVLSLSISELSSGVSGYTEKEAAIHFNVANEKGKTVFDWHAKKSSGELFWIEIALKKTIITGAERILAICRDIDVKKTTRLQLVDYKNRLEILVKERTEKLEEINQELLLTNEELFIQSEEMQRTLEILQNTQNQLVNSEKMASIGILAAGVAHEINNPLNFIQGGLSGLEDFFDENNQFYTDDNKQLIDAIQEGVSRAGTIVSSLNHFNRHGDMKMEACNLNDIIDNCLVILNNQLKNRINVIKNYSSVPLDIMGNDGKLHQAILNLLTNAEQAIEEKGEIEIQTLREDNLHKITIADNGMGIDKENLSRITEPFFTTKEPGKGTGLGLSICYNIINEHQGRLEFISDRNKGTTVIITLPRNK